jgi:nucleoside-diphosphate-sugar epimerase
LVKIISANFNLFNLSKAEKIDKIDVIIHIAGITKSLHYQNYYKINSKGTLELIKFAIKKNVKHFIYVSSLAAAGPTESSIPINENSTPNPVSHYGISKLIGEIYLKKSGLKYTIIRPPAIFGPGDKDIFTYFKMIKKGLAFTSGDKNKLYSMIYVKDLTDFMQQTILNEKAFNEIFFIANEKQYKISDILNAIERSINKKAVKINLPEITTNLICYPMQLYYALTGAPPLLNMDKLTEIKQKNWICSSEKAKKILDFTPKFALIEAFEETGKWYLEKKWL